MAKYLEWDFDNPKHRQRRRRQPLPLEGEVLGPEVEPTPRIRVEVVQHHQSRQGPTPQRLVIVAAMIVLGIILLRSPYSLLMLAVLIPANLWIAMAVTVAALFIISIYERWRGRPF
jgi:hypothetical protein